MKFTIYTTLVLTLLTTHTVRSAGLVKKKWPAGYVLHKEGENWKSPDGEYGFLVPEEETFLEGDAWTKLVHIGKKKVLHDLEDGRYFPGMNHGGLNIQWWKHPASDEGWCGLVEFGGRWEPSAVYLVEGGGDIVPHMTNIWYALNERIEKSLRAKLPEQAFEEKTPYVLTAEKIEPKGDTIQIMAVADANPKRMEGIPEKEVRIEARYTIEDQSLTVTVDGKALPEEEEEGDEEEVEVAEEGDDGEEEEEGEGDTGLPDPMKTAGDPPEVMRARLPSQGKGPASTVKRDPKVTTGKGPPKGKPANGSGAATGLKATKGMQSGKP